MNFLESTAEDIHQYARSILYETDESNLHSFEDTANYVVGKIYDDFLNHRGERIFELVRIFRHVTEDDMPPEGQQDVPQADHWLALSGTIGREKAWNSRLQSAGHRLLPDDAFETPMLRAALHQLGFTPDSDGFIRSLNDLSNYFHVEQALGSPYIVAQEEFVKPYGIESVVGIGSMFASGAMFILIGFTSTPLNSAQAVKFSQLAPFIGTLLARYETTKYPTWQSTIYDHA